MQFVNLVSIVRPVGVITPSALRLFIVSLRFDFNMNAVDVSLKAAAVPCALPFRTEVDFGIGAGLTSYDVIIRVIAQLLAAPSGD